MKVDEIKDELKKRNISYNKNYKKNELVELLTKSDVENK
jgi:predicted HTH domain antitoxin